MSTCQFRIARRLASVSVSTSTSLRSARASPLCYHVQTAAHVPSHSHVNPSLRSFASKSVVSPTESAKTSPVKQKKKKKSKDDIPKDDLPVVTKVKKKSLLVSVKEHLRRIQDPYHIAIQVQRFLKADRFDEALLLAQEAGKTGNELTHDGKLKYNNCVVSWNHLIEYQLGKERVRAAMKLYNLMRKYHQRPNEQTHTIILRGCYTPRHPEIAKEIAVSQWRGLLSADNKYVEPNVKHFNAALYACSRAGGLDEMFELVDTLDDVHQVKPDAVTFTTLLNALRQEGANALADAAGKGSRTSAKKLNRRLTDVLERCDGIWEEVMRRWRRGSLELDQTLVCSIGRVKLLGDINKQKEIFPLLEETMNLPRLDKGEAPSAQAAQRKPDPLSKPGKDTTQLARAALGHKPKKNEDKFPKPTVKTLSLVIALATNLRLAKVGMRYWNELVSNRNVAPDPAADSQLFGLLHLCHSSGEAATALSTMPARRRSHYHARTALATCLRDTNNPNLFANATSMLSAVLLDGAARTPDVKSLWLYLHVVQLHANRHHATATRNGAATENTIAWDPEHCVAVAKSLDDMWPVLCRLRQVVGLDEMISTRKVKNDLTEQREEQLDTTVAVVRKFIAIANKIVPSLSGKLLEDTKARRDELNRQAVVFTELTGKTKEDLDPREVAQGPRRGASRPTPPPRLRALWQQ